MAREFEIIVQQPASGSERKEMNTKRIKALLKREIIDVLRDRKTLIMMVLIPIFLYPLMIFFMSFIMSAMLGTSSEKVYKIAFVDIMAEDVQAIKDILEEKNNELQFEYPVIEAAGAETALNHQDVHVYLSSSEDVDVTITYLSAESDSLKVMSMVMDALVIYLDELRIERVEGKGLDREEILEPISFANRDLSTTEETMGNAMGGVIPVMMVVTILLAAIYPAIDVTAGEKERGTLETLITLPVTSFEMIMSKFLAVAMVACVSSLLNIVSMGVALAFLGNMLLGGTGGEGIHLATFLPAMLVTIVAMLFFALFVTAVCLFFCLFAKSFKEANNYATPIMLVFMLVAFLGALPDLELSVMTAGIPIINTALMVKQLFQLRYDYGLFGIVLASNAVYSFLMMWLLAKVYRSEAVLFGEGFSGVKLFARRSEMKKGQMPGLGDVVLLICIIFLALFYIGNAAALRFGAGAVAVNQAILLLVPVLYAWYLKNDGKRLFSIRAPKVRQLVGAAVLCIGQLLLNLVISSVLARLMPESTDILEQNFEILMEQPFIVLCLLLVFMPAIGEELLFRGFIFGTLREKMRPLTAMFISAVVFSLFHMSLVKIIPTFLIGFFIVLAAQRSGSIFVGMVIHLLNNLFSAVSMKYPEAMYNIPLMRPLLGAEELTLPLAAALLAAGVLGTAVGLMIIGKRKRITNENL